MDYNGAVTAYKKAVELDPKDTETRANLAILLEYDSDGTRYSEKARLKEAVDVLRELRKLDEKYGRKYDDNVLYDLWYAHDYQNLLAYAATLPTSTERKGLTLAAIAVLQGTDAALKRSLETTTDDQDRSKVLANAGALLLRVRKYPEAAVLSMEGARGQSNESEVARYASLLASTRPYNEFPLNQETPQNTVRKIFATMMSETLNLAEYKTIFYSVPKLGDTSLDDKQVKQRVDQVRFQVASSGVPITTVTDIVISNMRLTVDGDDSVGYKVIVEAPGAPAEDVYVVKDGNQYKGVAVDLRSGVADLAPLALQAIESNNLAAARKWLDRAREKAHVGTGDDPLAGLQFPNFWTKGQEADAATMRIAGLALLRSDALKEPYLSLVDQARAAETTGLGRARLTLVMAYAYESQARWTELLPLGLEVMRRYPDSLRAYELVENAYIGLKRYDDWEALIQTRLKQHPDEVTYVRSSSRVAAFRGQYSKAREILKRMIDQGKAQEGDMNQYSWYALFVPEQIDRDTLEVAERANELTKNNSFAILHTLACVDAQAGKTNQARDLLLKAMGAMHLDEPNSEVWFGFGLIAQQYGVLDAAEKMFARVEAPKVQYPDSTSILARQHMAALEATKSASKAVGH
jgi:tetratricopeptide (TPR) repeat protein